MSETKAIDSIKDFSRVISELEQGQFNADCSQQLEKALQALRERCDMDGVKSASASIDVKLKIIFESGNIEVRAEVNSKLPAKPRNRSIFWLAKDGKGICLENPAQPRLPFTVVSQKREVVDYNEERKDING